MDIEYLGPTRYDYGDSDSESECESPSTPPPITVRLKRSIARPTTLVISPHAPSGPRVGLVYAPIHSPTHPLGAHTPSPSLGSVLQTDKSTMHVLVDRTSIMPVELQHAWVRAVCDRLEMQRIVVVDAGDVEGQFRSPGVMAGQVIVGLPAAVMNYADARGIPCRHVRGQRALDTQEIDALFAQQAEPDTRDAGDAEALRPEVATSLYV
ncbi:hypothetical protein LPJ53_005868 [Coemansia erecta]|uniref:Uncharacterized protein n=1 Tax=Coemansia erecta TaxID=147472 RepID=A0A9W7XVV5_9FUNG|nr:hypothetical protein LPJ53_005868 [Coemansia erecta]